MNIDLVEHLLSTHTEDQVKATTIEFNDCALHLAARKRKVEIVELLVENGSVVDQQNVSKTSIKIICFWNSSL